MELRSHVRTFRVRVEEIGGNRQCFLGVGPALEMKILNDGIDQLRLCQLYSAIAEILNLDAQDVTDVALIINGEAVGARSQQVHDVDRVSVGAEDDAVLDVEQEDD